jgi:hypothetical protein
MVFQWDDLTVGLQVANPHALESVLDSGHIVVRSE